MDILVHCDGLPGGLVLVCVDVSQVGGVVSLSRKKYILTCKLVKDPFNLCGVISIADLTLPVEASGLETELGLLLDAAGHLLWVHSDRGVTDHIREWRHTSQWLVQVVCPVFESVIARASFIESVLKPEPYALPNQELDQEQEAGGKLDRSRHLGNELWMRRICSSSIYADPIKTSLAKAKAHMFLFVL